MEQTTTTASPPRHSRWGRDGIYNPVGQERTVPLSAAALRLIPYLHSALRHVLYPRHGLAHVREERGS